MLVILSSWLLPPFLCYYVKEKSPHLVKLWYMKVALTPAIHLGKPLSSASKKAASIPLTLFVWHEDPLTHLVKLTVCLISEDEAVIVIHREWNHIWLFAYDEKNSKKQNKSFVNHEVSFKNVKMNVVFVLNSNSKSFSHFLEMMS